MQKITTIGRLVAAGAVVTVLVAGGCSSSSDSSGGDAGGNANSEGVVAATAAVDKFTQPISALPTSEPLSSLPKGTKVAFIVNSLPVTLAISDGFKEAAGLLGLDVDYIDGGQSTDAASRAWDEAVAAKPDVVIQSAWPEAVFSRQLKELNDNGGKLISFANGSSGMNPPGIAVNLETLEDFGKMGDLEANYAISDSKGSANVLIPYLPDFPVSTAVKESAEATIKEQCPGCKVTDLALKVTDIGTKVPQQIVSKLQSDPGINYLLPTYDEIFTGIPAALKQAGLADKVKAVTQGAGKPVLNAIKADDVMQATIAIPDQFFGWELADTVARLVSGQPIPESTPDNFNFPVQILTASNIDFDTNEPWVGWGGYQDAYKKLWNVG